MNRNTAIVLVVLLLFAGAVFAEPILEAADDVYDAFTGGDTSMSTLVEFHDKDGNLIDVAMAITAGGQEVTTMSVTASWTVEGENIESGTFNMHGVIEIDKEDLSKDQPVYIPLDSWSFDSGEMIGSKSHTWILADLLPMEDQDIGWLLSIKAVFTPTATDLEGNPVAPDSSTTARISAGLSWDSQTGALSIIQCAVTKAYP